MLRHSGESRDPVTSLLLDRPTVNPQVVGSSPTRGARKPLQSRYKKHPASPGRCSGFASCISLTVDPAGPRLRPSVASSRGTFSGAASSATLLTPPSLFFGFRTGLPVLFENDIDCAGK